MNYVKIISGGAVFMGLSASIVATAIIPAALNITFDPAEIDCMALNIYHEARGETLHGQIGVAHVTLNRKKHEYFPNTICGVVYDNKQFSWTHLKEDTEPHEHKLYQMAKVIARDVIYGNVDDPTNGSMFYHALHVEPDWTSFMDLEKLIGAHAFYTWDGDWDAGK